MTNERAASPASAGDAASAGEITWWEPGFRARAVFDAVFILIGLGYLVSAFQLGAGTITQPGSGAFAVFAGSLLVVCLTLDLVKLIVAGGLRSRGRGRVQFKVVGILGAIGLYLVGVEILGHAITGSIVFAGLLFLLGSRSWWKIILIALLAGFGTDYLFTALLGLDLPTGLIEVGVDEWM